MIYYCVDCKRVNHNNEKCDYCGSTYLKPVKQGTSVNVIGSKLKGKVLNVKGDYITLILKDEYNNKYLKNFKMEQLKKIL